MHELQIDKNAWFANGKYGVGICLKNFSSL